MRELTSLVIRTKSNSHFYHNANVVWSYYEETKVQNFSFSTSWIETKIVCYSDQSQ